MNKTTTSLNQHKVTGFPWLMSLSMALSLLCNQALATEKKLPVAAAGNTSETKERPAVAVMKEPERVVLLVVNGQEITARNLVEAMQRNANITGAAPSDSNETRKALVKQLVAGLLVKEELKKKGLINDKQSQTEQSEVLQKFAAEHFPLPKDVEESVAYKYYENHQEEFGIAEIARVSQIQFVVPEGAKDSIKLEVKAKADAALKRLEAGEQFASLAGELTENPLGKLPKGDLGFIELNSNEWLKKNLATLKPGQHTGVIESPVGFEILMITDVRPAVITPYANVREKVIKKVKVAEQQRLRDIYIAGLAKEARIEIKDPDLAKLFGKNIFE